MRKEPTTRQAEVLKLILSKLLSQKEVSRRLKISEAAVSKHVSKLRQKGLLSGLKTQGLTPRVPPRVSNPEHPLRLHGEQYKVGIISSGAVYDKTRLRASSIWVNGNRVVLYRDSLMIFVYESFYGSNVDEVDALSGEYFYRLITRIESLYGLYLLKERKENVKRVKCHYAEINNELSDDLRRRKEKCRVFGSVDGKEWLLFDDSDPEGLGLSEMECTHSATARDSREARDDMRGVVGPFFNDLRDKKPSLTSEIEAAARQSMRSSSVTAKQMEAIASSVATLAKVLELQAQLPREDSPIPPVNVGKKPDYFG